MKNLGTIRQEAYAISQEARSEQARRLAALVSDLCAHVASLEDDLRQAKQTAEQARTWAQSAMNRR